MNVGSKPISWLLVELRRIRQRPSMFLTDDRLNSLACYLWGVFRGMDIAGVSDSDEERFLKSFGESLARRFEIGNANGDWWFCFVARPGSTGRIDDFYVELDRYLQEAGYARGLDDESIQLKDWSSH
jgi:hypothetical protein